MRFHAEVFQRASGFQPQQTAADHRPALAATGAGFDSVEVFNGTVNEAILGFGAFNRRDPRIGTGRHDQLVIINGTTRAGVNHFLLTVNGNCAFANQYLYAVLLVKSFTHQRELFRGVVREVG
ncbi:Uncharacterised protein [Salmonella enterica subsp. enterica serovar Bovismorbificans]|nr:Uncharacterised protein [Salmonella enterica subsp. enterica serovar Bovismorbificans]